MDKSGSAFPTMDEHGNYHITGLTKRELFAAAALIGVISRVPASTVITSTQVSTQAFEIADAMLTSSRQDGE